MTQVIVSGLAGDPTLSWLIAVHHYALDAGIFSISSACMQLRRSCWAMVLLTWASNCPSWQPPSLSLPGVPLFFSISGFLVGLSCLKSRGHWGVYAWHRALRIFPALWLCLLLTVLILIAFGRGSFLLSLTGVAWLTAQATVFQFFNPSQLRDFGVGVINGSLWTIPVEIQFYLLFPFVVSWLSFLSKKRKFGLTIVSITAVWSFSYFVYQVLLNRSLLDPESYFVKLLNVSLLPYFFQFLLGFACLLPLAFGGEKNCNEFLAYTCFRGRHTGTGLASSSADLCSDCNGFLANRNWTDSS